jgi:DNA-binding FadR family transcriptional regulator
VAQRAPRALSGSYAVPQRDLRSDIKRLLLDLNLKSGDPLPTEAEMIEILQVSRGSLREALKSLQAVGIIETRHGSGSYVGELSLSAMIDGLAFHSQLGKGNDDLTTAVDLADIREIVESALIGRVAAAVTPSLLEDLEGLIGKMNDVVPQSPEFAAIDRGFHERLYVDLGNSLIAGLLDAFWHALDPVRSSLPQPFADPHEAVEKHQAILEALRRGSGTKAAAAMHDHFAVTREWILSARK